MHKMDILSYEGELTEQAKERLTKSRKTPFSVYIKLYAKLKNKVFLLSQ